MENRVNSPSKDKECLCKHQQTEGNKSGRTVVKIEKSDCRKITVDADVPMNMPQHLQKKQELHYYILPQQSKGSGSSSEDERSSSDESDTDLIERDLIQELDFVARISDILANSSFDNKTINSSCNDIRTWLSNDAQSQSGVLTAEKDTQFDERMSCITKKLSIPRSACAMQKLKSSEEGTCIRKNASPRTSRKISFSRSCKQPEKKPVRQSVYISGLEVDDEGCLGSVMLAKAGRTNYRKAEEYIPPPQIRYKSVDKTDQEKLCKSLKKYATIKNNCNGQSYLVASKRPKQYFVVASNQP